VGPGQREGPPGRVLALDLGARRIGVALSDPGGVIAQPHGVIERRGLRETLEHVAALVAAHGVARVVVGEPLTLAGHAGRQAAAAARFVRALQARVPVPVERVDERLSTAAAERALLAGGASRARRRATRDAVAAALILQTYLDRRRAAGAPGGADPPGPAVRSSPGRSSPVGPGAFLVGGKETVLDSVGRARPEVAGVGTKRETISLVDDQGNEHEFNVVDVIEVASRRYAVLQPTEGGDEAVIFRVEDDETLSALEDEEEFNRVAAALEDLEEEEDIVDLEDEDDENLEDEEDLEDEDLEDDLDDLEDDDEEAFDEEDEEDEDLEDEEE